eukprot:1001088-Amphidinium_carterae.1
MFAIEQDLAPAAPNEGLSGGLRIAFDRPEAKEVPLTMSMASSKTSSALERKNRKQFRRLT